MKNKYWTKSEAEVGCEIWTKETKNALQPYRQRAAKAKGSSLTLDALTECIDQSPNEGFFI